MATALLLAAALLPGLSGADEQVERRILIGLKLFPALIAADEELAAKRDSSGRLHIWLLYQDDHKRARDLAGRLMEYQRIREMPISVHLRRGDELDAPFPAAIFIADPNQDLLPLIRFAQGRQIILFSPFKGDVERGVQAGIAVSDRIFPLVNPEALRAANIHLKPFFLEVAKTHE